MSSRRWRRLGAAVVAVVVAVAVVTAGGCTGGADGGARPSPTSSPGDPAGPVLRVGVPEEPASLDPFDPQSRTPAGVAILGVVLPQLFRVDPSGEPQGWLADDVRESADGLSVSFKLRPGARWSDGVPVSADDLRFTRETILADGWPGPRAGYDRLVAVDADGGRVRFRFGEPFPGWRRLFSGADFVLPAHRLRSEKRDAWAGGPDLAAGPFKLGPVTPGLEVVLERNETWWGERSRAARLRVVVVPDARTMEQLLARGELDVAWPAAAPNRVGRLKALDGIQVDVAPAGGRLVSLVANTERLDRHDRRALLGLVAPDRFVEVLLAGEADVATGLTAGSGPGPWAGGQGAAGSGADPRAGSPGAAGSGADPRAGAQGAAGPGLDLDRPVTLTAAEEAPMAALLGRVLADGVRREGGEIELAFTEATRVYGAWLPSGEFDVAIVDEVSWPEPCWRCQYGEAAIGRGNTSRARGLDALASAAEAGGPPAAGALELRLRHDAVVLPLWRPRAVLAGRGVSGLEANSWSNGPFWSADRWELR